MSRMSDNSVNKILVGVLVFLCVAIVGLGVGVGVVMISQQDDHSVVASEFYYDLEEQYTSEMEMTVEDVLEKFDEKIASIKDSDFRMTFVLWRAKFVAVYGDGALVAVDYLEREGDGALMNDETKYDYYSNLCYYYGMLGNEERVQYYLERMKELKSNNEVSLMFYSRGLNSYA